jgi:hypothetical protein
MSSFDLSLNYIRVQCAECKIIFAITKKYIYALLDTHANFCCPNGHWQLCLTKSEKEQLKDALKKIEAAEFRKSEEISSLKRQLEIEHRSVIAYKAHFNRLKNQAKSTAAELQPEQIKENL